MKSESVVICLRNGSGKSFKYLHFQNSGKSKHKQVFGNLKAITISRQCSRAF